MTAKEYLEQAFHLDQRINSKIAMVDSLNLLATKATTTISDMPRNPNRATSMMGDAVEKIIDLQLEINSDIDQLVDLKREIMTVIKAVENSEYQMLLEKRYLCYYCWEQIASEMNYGLDNVFKVHRRALTFVALPEKCTEDSREFR